jgi:hypothetical protein
MTRSDEDDRYADVQSLLTNQESRNESQAAASKRSAALLGRLFLVLFFNKSTTNQGLSKGSLVWESSPAGPESSSSLAGPRKSSGPKKPNQRVHGPEWIGMCEMCEFCVSRISTSHSQKKKRISTSQSFFLSIHIAKLILSALSINEINDRSQLLSSRVRTHKQLCHLPHPLISSVLFLFLFPYR